MFNDIQITNEKLEIQETNTFKMIKNAIKIQKYFRG